MLTCLFFSFGVDLTANTVVSLYVCVFFFQISSVLSTAQWKRLPACLPVFVWVHMCVRVYVSLWGNMIVWMPLHVYTPRSESVCPARRSMGMQGARSSALQVLLLSCCVCAAAGYPFRTPLDLDVTPRVTVLSSGKHKHSHTKVFCSKISSFLNSLWCITFLSNGLNKKYIYFKYLKMSHQELFCYRSCQFFFKLSKSSYRKKLFICFVLLCSIAGAAFFHFLHLVVSLFLRLLSSPHLSLH